MRFLDEGRGGIDIFSHRRCGLAVLCIGRVFCIPRVDQLLEALRHHLILAADHHIVDVFAKAYAA